MLSIFFYAVSASNLHKRSDTASLGCFRDSGDRVFSDILTDPNAGIWNDANLSSSSCISFCAARNYAYAGLEDGNECLCGTTSQFNSLTGIDNGSCNKPCTSGNGICGGAWALQVYATGFQEPTLNAIGCFKDSGDRVFPDILGDPNAGNWADPANSISKCISFCASRNYAFAGLEDGNECLCGTTAQFQRLSPIETSNCNTRCPLRGGTCGGAWALQVYGTGAVDNTAHGLGCYEDTRDRVFSDILTDTNAGNWNDPNLSISSCKSFCASRNYTFAGLEDGNSCLCGTTTQFKALRPISTASCNKPCPVGGGTCGRAWALQVYESGFKEIITSAVGCYLDTGARVFPDIFTNPNSGNWADDRNSIAKCISFCAARNYAFAGLEDGNECLCGTNEQFHSLTVIDSGRCNKPCPLGGGTCGGAWALQVHSTTTLGTCFSNANCPSGSICLGMTNGGSGVCGNADSSEDLLNPDVVEQQTRRLLVSDNTAWTEGDDRTVIREVVMAHSLAPLANDAYKAIPTSIVGNWHALTPAITANFDALFKWKWLSFTIYGDVPNDRYVIAFKGTDPNRVNEILTDLTGLVTPCNFHGASCGQYHKGFHVAYAALGPKVIDAVRGLNLTPASSLYIIGHSLGGALASICALDLVMGQVNVKGVITFGSPRIGDALFENVYHAYMTHRNVLHARFAAINNERSAQDVVTMLAPLSAGPVLPYSRPIQNVIVGVSPVCGYWTLGCEVKLHPMDSSYIPMIQTLYDAAIRHN